MPGEFLEQFFRGIGYGRQDVLTPVGWPLWSHHLSSHNFSVEDASKQALDRLLWGY